MPYFFRKLGKMSQNLWSAAVVIGALRAKYIFYVISGLWHCVVCFFGAVLLIGEEVSLFPSGQVSAMSIPCLAHLSQSLKVSFCD